LHIIYVRLTLGFKYLGYFLKAGKTLLKTGDGYWLKFESRIKHWCNRWLTLGGHCILVKVVLETQAVFWMALAAVPATILINIRKLIFDFLWTGGRKESGIHLCSWVRLAKPKSLGGWGLQEYFFLQPCVSSQLTVESIDGGWTLASSGQG
jgi:hypothetical protein